MKITTLTSFFVLLSVVSMVAIVPSAFADHTSATVTNALGSQPQVVKILTHVLTQIL